MYFPAADPQVPQWQQLFRIELALVRLITSDNGGSHHYYADLRWLAPGRVNGGRSGRTGRIDTEHLAGNQWRFWLARPRTNTGLPIMRADLMRAGIHFALDCLSDLAVSDFGPEDCDAIIEVGSGSSDALALAVADDGELGNSATTTKGENE